jgi:hypothetical protein
MNCCLFAPGLFKERRFLHAFGAPGAELLKNEGSEGPEQREPKEGEEKKEGEETKEKLEAALQRRVDACQRKADERAQLLTVRRDSVEAEKEKVRHEARLRNADYLAELGKDAIPGGILFPEVHTEPYEQPKHPEVVGSGVKADARVKAASKEVAREEKVVAPESVDTGRTGAPSAAA